MKFRIRDYFYPVRVLGFHNLMKSAPSWEPEQLGEWSRARRKGIVVHAYHHVPYYRRLLDEQSIKVEKIDDPAIWKKIPTLDKNLLRNNHETLIAEGGFSKGTVWTATSGSTGMPLKILLDHNVNAAAFALFWRAWSSGGYWRLGQRQAVLKGLHNKEGWQYHRSIRALELSSVQVDRKTVGLYRDLLNDYRPRFMRGYPSSIYLFCRLLREEGLDLHIPMIISGSEMLHDFQRAMIEETLGARLFNHYTHWERAASILECDQGNLHAQEDYGHHEILDIDGKPVPPGMPGELTVTGLHNLAMPLIRYRTGDIACWSLETCSCGQVYPVISHIEGRQNDYLISCQGGVTAGTSAVYGLKMIPNILYFQVIQREICSVEVRLVKTSEFHEVKDTQSVREALWSRLGSEMEIEVRFCDVNELVRNPVGKIRSCFNELPPEVLSQFALPGRREKLVR